LNNGTAVNITHGTSVPVNITVAAKAPATGTPTGRVSLIANLGVGQEQGVDGFLSTVAGNGSVTSSTTLLPGGSYTVHAHYAGDGTFGASDSTPVSVVVSPEASQTSLGIFAYDFSGNLITSNATTFPYGSNYVLHVDVTDSTGVLCEPSPFGGPACPTGTVALTDNGSPLDLGNYQLNSLGELEDQPIQLAAGMHTLAAAYGGDNSYLASTSTQDTVTVTQAATSTTLSAPTFAVSGSITATATIATQSNATASPQEEPTGSVQFLVNGNPAGNPVQVIGGVDPTTMFAMATATSKSIPVTSGQNSITAKYSGDSNYQGSASPSKVVTVGPFAMSVSPSTVTIATPGSSGTATVTITGESGYNGTINFTSGACSGLPALSSCSFSPASVTGSGTTTLTISTTAPTGSRLIPPGPPEGFHWPATGTVGVVLGLLLLVVGLTTTRTKRVRLAGALVFIGLTILATGCGSSSAVTGGSSSPGTPAGNYTVTVTATQSGFTSSASFTLTVQ
jgi:Bacterial Ig-like domain (group 3)